MFAAPELRALPLVTVPRVRVVLSVSSGGCLFHGVFFSVCTGTLVLHIVGAIEQGNNLQCSQTHVNVMAPLPSFPLTTCPKKSVLRHMMLSGNALLASASASTSCQIFPIAFFVHVGISSFSNPPSSHTFAMPWKLSH